MARRGSRGQVLIIAVLVLFAVASVAALLAAIVGAQIVQVTRYTDVSELRSAAESILALANEQLTYGWQGADWRPPPTYQVGKAIVGISVNYGPGPDGPQQRFMRISVAARFPDDPFLRYSTLAFKPLLLTDYARFITDRYEMRQPAALGASGLELGGRPRPNSVEAGGYEFTIEGPIRSNTDLEWHGRSQVSLFTQRFPYWQRFELFRDDRIEVAGAMRPALRPGQPDLSTYNEPSVDANPLRLAVDGEVRINNVFRPDQVVDQKLYTSGFADEAWAGIPVTNSWRVLADLPRFQAMFPVDQDHPELSATLSVPRVQPPRLDAVHPEMHTNRYLILTRDSGKWTTPPAPQVGLVNTGANGWGWANYGGIYLDNFEDVQYGHDLDKLRRNWMGGFRQPEDVADGRDEHAGNPPAWWDRTGRYYTPPGVEIILHGEAQCPYLEIVRHTVRYHPNEDGISREPYYWLNALGQLVKLGAAPTTYTPEQGEAYCPRPGNGVVIGARDNVATFPFPANGVIYAEGNVRIRGVMPANGNDPTKPPTAYFGTTLNTTKTPAVDRCYDLQVVSGGTIYIEGDLLSATAARLYGTDIETDPDKVRIYDRDRAARLALIARDNVCVNTTALQPRPANLEPAVGSPDTLNDGQTVYPDPGTDGYPPYMFFRGPAGVAATADNIRDFPQPTVPVSAQFVYSSVRLQLARLKGLLPELRLIMGHSGWYVADETTDGPAVMPPDVEPDRNAQVRVRRFLNGLTSGPPWRWSQDQEQYTFRGPGVGSPSKDASEHWYLENEGIRAEPFAKDDNGDPLLDYAEFLPDNTQTMVLDRDLWSGAPDRLIFEPTVVPVGHQDPVTNQYVWDVDPHQLGYILGPLAVAPQREKDGQLQAPLPVEIDALVYAQNGSWFILPGPWFNEDPDEVYDSNSKPGGPYPAYHEPLNIALSFYGAISENMPAPIGDVTDWTSKWAGPYGARGGFLTYTYDPVLRWYRGEARRPVFPNMLLTPDLIVWGERVAGASGAGT